MTAAGSIGFLGVIRYRTAFIIGLCTLAAYWFDDLVDLTRDETRVPTLRALRSVRVVLLVLGLSMVTLCLFWLLPRESKQLLVLLACLAILATAFCLRHALAPRPLLGPIPY
jgi:4-hydroxybenzoate polyprenyltransferase